MKKSITAIVLAGGQSSRMGRDKALLSFGERTLLSQICHVARECATQVYIVTPWIEKYQHIVPQNCQLIREKLLSPNKQSVLHHHGMVEVDGETGRGIQAGAETSRDSTDGPNVVGNRPHRVLPLRWGDGTGHTSRRGKLRGRLRRSPPQFMNPVQRQHGRPECGRQPTTSRPPLEMGRRGDGQNAVYSDREFIPLCNAQTSNSPIIGFVQALQQVDTDWVLLLACDLPKLQSPQVKSWYEDLIRVLPTQIALLPRNCKGWEPLCGFYRRSCLPLLEAYIAAGGRSFQNFLAQHSIAELQVRDRSCLFNCNTPEDWKKVTGDR